MKNDKTINYDDGIISRITEKKFELTINESSFSNELYTTDYINSVFNSLEIGCANCALTIEKAKEYFNKINETEGIPQPELIDFSYDFNGSIAGNGVVVTPNTDGKINVRSSASLVDDSNIKEIIPNGTVLKIIDEENDMYKIEYADGKIGYVSKKYIHETTDIQDIDVEEMYDIKEISDVDKVEELSNEIGYSETEIKTNAKVSTKDVNGHLNVHLTPDTDSDSVISMLDNKTNVKIIGEENDMYKIEYGNGQTGYVSKKYIEQEPIVVDNSIHYQNSETTYLSTGEVVTKNIDGHLNVHLTPDFDKQSVIEMLDNGQKIKIIGENEKMYEIEYDNGKTGYVSKNYIQKK